MPEYNLRDFFIIAYSDRWALRHQTGVTHMLFKTQQEAIDTALSKAKLYESEVYLEEKPGKFKKIKRPPT